MTGFVVQGHILEWFLKDHVTLKTGVMMLEIQIYLTVAFENIWK